MALLHMLGIGSFKKPRAARYWAAALLLVLVATKVCAQETTNGAVLTEVEVVARALRRAPLSEAIEGAVDAEVGRGRAAGAYPNPQVAYMREQTFGALGTAEDYLTVTQTIDLGNRRGLQGEAGDVRASAARREGDAARVSVAADARLRFYEVLYRQSRTAALEGWSSRIERALTIVTYRERRGDAATYDRRRIERERVFVEARLESERAALERAAARLSAITGAAAPVMVSGELLPSREPAATTALTALAQARPDLEALELRAKAAEVTRKAATRWWAPDLRIEGGWKGVEHRQQTRSDGFLLGAALSIPLWDRATGLSRVASGEARAARGRRELLSAELNGELEGARAEAVRLRLAAIVFRERSSRASGELERIASAGYEGGELGLLELLDAYRSTAEDSLVLLDLEHAARRAQIELDRVTGNTLR